MTSTLLKYNVILIVLCIGITLIHNSSGEKVIMNNINLYYDPLSPPCRSVLLTLEALNLQFNLKYISLLDKGTNSPELKKLILYTLSIPVIEDGDFVLSESHAIIVYLVRKYGKQYDHPLYPNDPKLQAQVNQRLHFDNGTLYPAFKIQYNSWTFFRIPKTPEREAKIHEALKFLEEVLEKSTWTAGDSMTVADFALVASISTFEVNGVELAQYNKISEWLKNCKDTMEGYDTANQKGIDDVAKDLEKRFAELPQTKAL